MTVIADRPGFDRLPAYALFAAVLASAGLPLYIHAPKFYVDTYGVSLAALGSVLFGLRLLDVVQDPLLGRIAQRLRHRRAVSVAVAMGCLALGMVGLFAVTPPVAPLWWFALTLTLVFSAFSFLTICFYAQGVEKAGQLGPNGHLAVARWRETGALAGVCVAAIAPVVLGRASETPYALFALGFVGLCMAGGVAMAREWIGTGVVSEPGGFARVLGDKVARRLLGVALVNAAPVAVSSTLFLFFVETRLDAPGLEGVLLLAFFLSAALAAPVWTKLAEALGMQRVLFGAMFLSIAAFSLALMLGPGDWLVFTLICVISGAALGADMTILPALFSARMAKVDPSASEAFGLWSFVSKLTLALAAVTLLPALDAVGFSGGPSHTNTPQALWALSLLYAGVPCILKAVAIGLLATIKLEEDR